MPYVVQSCTACQMACEPQKLGPVYAAKSCHVYLGHPPTRASLRHKNPASYAG